jgi:hypothetical protein
MATAMDAFRKDASNKIKGAKQKIKDKSGEIKGKIKHKIESQVDAVTALENKAMTGSKDILLAARRAAAERKQLRREHALDLFKRIDLNGDGDLRASELNAGLLKQHVLVPREITNRIVIEIRRLAQQTYEREVRQHALEEKHVKCQGVVMCLSECRATYLVGQQSINADDFADFLEVSHPANPIIKFRSVGRSIVRCVAFWLVLLYFFGAFLSFGNNVIWLHSPLSGRLACYQLLSLCRGIGSVGYIWLLCTRHEHEFDVLEHTRLKLKTDIIDELGNGQLPAGWSHQLIKVQNAATRRTSVDYQELSCLDELGPNELKMMFQHFGLLIPEDVLGQILGDMYSSRGHDDFQVRAAKALAALKLRAQELEGKMEERAHAYGVEFRERAHTLGEKAKALEQRCETRAHVLGDATKAWAHEIDGRLEKGVNDMKERGRERINTVEGELEKKYEHTIEHMHTLGHMGVVKAHHLGDMAKAKAHDVGDKVLSKMHGVETKMEKAAREMEERTMAKAHTLQARVSKGAQYADAKARESALSFGSMTKGKAYEIEVKLEQGTHTHQHHAVERALEFKHSSGKRAHQLSDKATEQARLLKARARDVGGRISGGSGRDRPREIRREGALRLDEFEAYIEGGCCTRGAGAASLVLQISLSI